jgi:diamine N-acetyltransferase
MQTLKGDFVYLRALEPEDLDLIYRIENDESIWELSHTQTPYSRYLIKEYLENAHRDIYETKQLRLVICGPDSSVLGLVDLFDFDPKNKRVGLGILIINPQNRGTGIGSEALDLVMNYGFNHLNIHQIYCNISEVNTASIALFEKKGFLLVGVKKDWNFNYGVFTNERLYQLIKNVH